MSTKKNKFAASLRGALESPPPPQPDSAPVTTPQQGSPYPLSTKVVPEAIVLPPAAEALGTTLQDIARHYITARRRTGEALLEAAKWLSEARELAHHGEWLLFLEITGTSPDSAERLLNIHARAIENPQFGEAIIRGWLSQSAAALLARPSTPTAIVEQVLTADKPPQVQDVQRVLRATTHQKQSAHTEEKGNNQIPQIAVFGAAEDHLSKNTAPIDNESEIEPLDSEERAVITRLLGKVERYTRRPQLMSEDDRELLERLVQRLEQLLRHHGS